MQIKQLGRSSSRRSMKLPSLGWPVTRADIDTAIGEEMEEQEGVFGANVDDDPRQVIRTDARSSSADAYRRLPMWEGSL